MFIAVTESTNKALIRVNPRRILFIVTPEESLTTTLKFCDGSEMEIDETDEDVLAAVAVMREEELLRAAGFRGKVSVKSNKEKRV
jgi:hypothetical protein